MRGRWGVGAVGLALWFGATACATSWKEQVVQGRYAEAEQLLQAERQEATRRLANALRGLAWLYYVEGRHQDAEPLFQRALRLTEEGFGRDDLEVAAILENLAGLYTAERRFTEAEPLYARALAIRQLALGPQHPTVATNLWNYAALLRQTSQPARAAELEARAQQIQGGHRPHPTQ